MRIGYELPSSVFTPETRTINATNKQIDIVRYHAIVIVQDEYDFDPKEWDSFGNFLNSGAYYLHQIGVGTDYEWKAIYIYTTEWENAS